MRDPDLPEPPPRRDRGNLGKLIRRRPRVGTGSALLMSLGFALIASLLVLSDSVLLSTGVIEFKAGEPAPVTLRVAQFTGFSDPSFDLQGGPIVIARGQMVDAEKERLARAIIDQRPSGIAAMGAFMAAFFLIALLYTTQLRRSHRGRLLRTQAVTLLLILGGAVVFKVGLLYAPISVFVIPVAGLAIVATLVVDVSAGLATGLIASVLCGLLVPFDMAVLAILAAQSMAAVLVAGEKRHKNRHVILAGLVSALGAVLAYIVLHYLLTLESPLYDLGDPLRATVFAAAAGGLISAFVAILAQPIYQFLLGDITRNKLVELEDLSNPLLKQIAQDSPGTWQHSLAMANMAEVATQAIGGNGRLVRVGAYYHDLGKSLQPKYFIENLQPGESSPHDRLPPEVSCDAIFAHVTEGIRVGRKAGLPERIIDFMHMHHGDGLLQYFWTKCQESGNPKGLTVEDFRYPGIPPQSRETAILAIVDAVEAASRTLKSNDDQEISKLVQRIVYGKLHLGQLDESGLSMADLRKISDSLRESIKHGRHGRIEYPWQREERAAKEAAARAAAESRPLEERARPAGVVRDEIPASRTQRLIQEPRLDSLDVPRPYWRESPGGRVVDNEKAPAPNAPAPEPMPAPAAVESVAASRASPSIATSVDPDEARPPGRSSLGGSRPADPPWAAKLRATGQHSAVDAAQEPGTGPIVLPKKKQQVVIATGDEPPAKLTRVAGVDLNATAPLSSIPETRELSAGHSRPSEDPAARVLARAKAEAEERVEASASAPGPSFDDEPTSVATSLSASSASNPPPEAAPEAMKSGFSHELPPGVERRPPPPPGSKERNKGSTIELMKEARAATSQPVADDEIEEEAPLTPGTLVLGPPPATRSRDEVRRTREMPSAVTIKPKKKS